MKDESGSSEGVALMAVLVAFILVAFVYSLVIALKFIILLLAAIGLAIYVNIKVQEEKRHQAEEATRLAEEAGLLERRKAVDVARLKAGVALLERTKAEASRKESEMKTPNELLEELFNGCEKRTDIQNDAHVKKLKGNSVVVVVVGEIRDINSKCIFLQKITPELSGGTIHVSYEGGYSEGSQLRAQLQEYSPGDCVEMTTQFNFALFGSRSCFLDLLSIRRLNR